MSAIPRVSTTGISIRDFPSPGQSLGDMTLRDGSTGIGTRYRLLRRGRKRLGLGWRPSVLVARTAAADMSAH